MSPVSTISEYSETYIYIYPADIYCLPCIYRRTGHMQVKKKKSKKK
jgi:hypothetical protein